MPQIKLTVKRFGEGHWEVLGLESGPVGPYDNRAEAESDRVGLERFGRMERRGVMWMCSENEGEQYEVLP